MHSRYSKRVADPARLEAVAAMSLLEGPVPEELFRSVRVAAKSLKASAAAFLVLEANRFTLRGSVGLPPALTDQSHWPLEWDFLLEAAFEGPKVRAFSNSESVSEANHFPTGSLSSFLGAPVVDVQGRCLGVLVFWNQGSREWSSDDFDLIAEFTSVLRDFLEARRAEEAIKASEEKLRQIQKMEALGRLAGSVAHDFNNFLTAINGFSDLLLMSVAKDDSRRQNLEEIRIAGTRAAALTSQLLAFSRKQVLAPRRVDLNTVVSGMETMLRRLIGENIGFRTCLKSHLPMVIADPSQMEKIILNLVLNARDAMPNGGELTVLTDNRHLGKQQHSSGFMDVVPGDYAILSVGDTGTGMDHETKSRLFEPLFTTKAKDKGTGLSLSIIYGAVKQANGTITVETELDKGTVFSIFLPAVS